MSLPGNMVNSFDPARATSLPARERALVERRAAALGPAYKLLYEQPVEFVRGEGVLLFDAEGRDYLDAYNNVPCVGHCHPRVAEAVARQARTLNTNTRYLAEPILDYAERLLATHAAPLGRVMFTCTGSEATDLALRIARSFTGAPGVVVSENAYHGITAWASEVSPSLGEGVHLGRDVRAVAPPQPGEDDGGPFAARVQAAIDDLRRHGTEVAAVLLDSILTSDGLVPEPAGFLAPVADVARRAGALYIADEVQPGFGRTGEAMWGYQRHGIEPDLVTMGKPMGNGMPIAGVVARPELLEDFGRNARYFNTFAANSVSIAAATAVLDVLEDERLLDNSATTGGELLAAVAALAERHPRLSRPRGAGLFVAVDLVAGDGASPDPPLAAHVINALRERRVLVSGAGRDASSLKVRPPLPFDSGDAQRFMDALEAVTEEIPER